MKTIIIILTTILGFAAHAQQKNDSIIGFWTEKDAIQMPSFFFKKDNHFERKYNGRTDFGKYKIENDILYLEILAFTTPEGLQKECNKFESYRIKKLTETELVMANTKGCKGKTKTRLISLYKTKIK
jgi:hypothetical protein